MVDVMASPSEDFEDGELLEDGEICDDEAEETPTPKQEPPKPEPRQRSSPAKESPRSGSVSAQQQQQHHEKEKERNDRADRDRNDRTDKDRQDREMREGRESKPDRADRQDRQDRPDRDRDRRSPAHPQQAHHLQADVDLRRTAPWGDGASAATSHENEEGSAGDFFNNGQDKDYRFEDDTYRDFDYRPNRKRRASPTEDDWDPRDRRRPFGGRGGFRGGRRARFDTQQQICKFFREGYCRDGNDCAYSHDAATSMRRPELCKFYATGYCKKGLTCHMLHGEFPCKAHHKGECNHDPCRFSHVPLTDYTRPIFQKMIDEDELVNARMPTMGYMHAMQMPTQAPRRRVLLPGGPSGMQNIAVTQAAAAPIIHVPIPNQQTSTNGQLAPPSVVVPTLAKPLPDSSAAAALVAKLQSSMRPVQSVSAIYGSPQLDTGSSPQQLPPAASMSLPNNNNQPGTGGPAPIFNINAMLAQLSEGAVPEESPSSPPPMPSSIPLPSANIPESKEISWRLLPVKCNSPYSGLAGVEFDASSSDPRKPRVLASLFEATTQSLLSSPGAQSGDASSAASAVSRDPRRRTTAPVPSGSAGADSPRVRSSSWMPQIA
ncbi:hypothetical protein WR25_22272 [Diploscapter pachys]|uniref:C3H1-type domain-containing protein n=1 Tax=Diploscapter pachys TaxID=2018661 RepID=A0A2A2L5J4_9BILA|nr:hypothetical protein WR25_22272 [Diploscapter pachys]